MHARSVYQIEGKNRERNARIRMLQRTIDHYTEMNFTQYIVQQYNTPFCKSTLYVCSRTPVVDTKLPSTEFLWNHG